MVKELLDAYDVEDIKTMAAAHFWPHSRQAGDMSDETGVKLVVRGEGSYVQDAAGKQWFDLISGMWLKNAGHGRREIADAVYEQMLEISYTPGGSVSPVTARLAAKLAGISPDPGSRIYFTSGGAESVETALKMSRKYHKNNGEPGRFKFIARRGSYHGATFMNMTLGGGSVASGSDYGPLMPYSVNIAQPGEYRCRLCRGMSACDLECARDLEIAIQAEGPSTVAAFIAEPISISAGVHVPHPEYWPTIREICDKYGVLLICDEVITGFGRTGKWFATEHWGIKPDIFTVAKALTSGYLPIGAAVASKPVADAFIGDQSATFRHLITFGGNPPACAAGLANLEIMERENLVGNSARLGEYLFDKLQSMYEHPIIGDVRGGLGLLCSLEFVKDRATKEKIPADANLTQLASAEMNKEGILGRVMGDVMHLAPPLSTTRDELDELVEKVDRIIGAVEAQL
ncbi:MAG: aspartate aminotransferase family protein [Chloroflexi bacterium]|nr:aspartate aminotransferase family protein [Chloroflexota bacterium]